MVLEQILAENRKQLEIRKKAVPLSELKTAVRIATPPLDFFSALNGKGIRLIAEVKKASPSRGIIRHDFNPIDIAGIYARNGAAAISVLTETKYFQGNLEYLKDIKISLENKLPLLRKDFIDDPFQVYESRANGADAILLIVAILEQERLKELFRLSNELGMRCLVEVHDEDEVQIALNIGAGIIGINNRDLKTFNVDIAVTERLRSMIPPGKIVVSESGIKNRNDIEKLQRWGINAVLIGESLMAATDIGAKMRELL